MGRIKRIAVVVLGVAVVVAGGIVLYTWGSNAHDRADSLDSRLSTANKKLDDAKDENGELEESNDDLRERLDNALGGAGVLADLAGQAQSVNDSLETCMDFVDNINAAAREGRISFAEFYTLTGQAQVQCASARLASAELRQKFGALNAAMDPSY